MYLRNYIFVFKNLELEAGQTAIIHKASRFGEFQGLNQTYLLPNLLKMSLII